MNNSLKINSLLLMLTLPGCMSPSEKFISYAEQFVFTTQLIAGKPYQHRLFLNKSARNLTNNKVLHIYLDGDGSPWRTASSIADDPSSRNPLILELMAKDSAAALLLGRPCYYELQRSALCNDTLWTSKRYSALIIDSMAAAMQDWLSKHASIDKLVLIGYSGGGVLATLLASRLPRVVAIVTIAANLDIRAWGMRHGYQPPDGSLNPIIDAHIPDGIKQIHLAGLKDENVPADIVAAFSRSQQNSVYLAFAEYDHICCWVENWSNILQSQLGDAP